MMCKCFALWLCLFASQMVLADVLVGRVASIADGDTLTLLDAANQQHLIRLTNRGLLLSLGLC